MAWTNDETEAAMAYPAVPMTRDETSDGVPDVRRDSAYHHVQKVWGNELWIVNTEHYCGKMLTVGKDHHTSMHFHAVKHETMFCVEGQFRLDFIDRKGQIVSRTLNQSDSIVIPPLTPHSIYGLGDFNVLFEFSTQHHDSDSIRVGKPG